jgi:hypothetical protein
MTALLMQLLGWLDARPRTYGETMEAWRTSCPRMPIWEDATDGDLVEIVQDAGVGFHESIVRLTASGRAMLDATRDPERRA